MTDLNVFDPGASHLALYAAAAIGAFLVVRLVIGVVLDRVRQWRGGLATRQSSSNPLSAVLSKRDRRGALLDGQRGAVQRSPHGPIAGRLGDVASDANGNGPNNIIQLDKALAARADAKADRLREVAQQRLLGNLRVCSTVRAILAVLEEVDRRHVTQSDALEACLARLGAVGGDTDDVIAVMAAFSCQVIEARREERACVKLLASDLGTEIGSDPAVGMASGNRSGGDEASDKAALGKDLSDLDAGDPAESNLVRPSWLHRSAVRVEFGEGSPDPWPLRWLSRRRALSVATCFFDQQGRLVGWFVA
ncbi:MAG: hypothetical protein AAGG72_04220 [Pseudomonadota bacterium]